MNAMMDRRQIRQAIEPLADRLAIELEHGRQAGLDDDDLQELADGAFADIRERYEQTLSKRFVEIVVAEFSEALQRNLEQRRSRQLQ